MENTLPAHVRFGEFDLDLKTGELRGAGQTVRLSEKSFRIVLILVEHGGELVTRDDIQKKLWPNDTVVDFEHGTNTAMKNLRRALGDSVEEPKYIETVPRRGYRLMVPVEWIAVCEDSSSGVGAQAVCAGDIGSGVQSDPGALTGRTVSHYRVLDIIGGGGMGVVYRAEDLKLGRLVALKFLPEELGSDTLALERFSREARAASSLDQPNICAIHEFGEHEGRPFIVMQLFEGQTLRDRLVASGGPLPLKELLDIGIQVSDGLRAAHEKGIIHRDIKPANIFLTSKGTCKILDFGLAKLLEGDEEEALVVSSDVTFVPRPAASVALTLSRTGVAMGTAGYMSPEQVRGEKLDGRTDIFSFGLVLYEMATGQRAFSGETAAVVHDAILNNSPVPVSELNSTLPAKLVSTIDKALEKDRELRHRSAAEIGAELRALQPHSRTRSRISRFTVVGIVALLVCSTGLLLLRSRWKKQETAKQPVVRQLTPTSPVLGAIALSKDGKHLAYLDRAKGITLLQIDSGETRSFSSTTSLIPVSWLPDGDHLFVWRHDEPGTWSMSMLDGALRKFHDESIRPVISPDGLKTAFSMRTRHNEVWVMGAMGEAPHRIVSIDPAWTIDYLAWSPTGRRIAYVRWRKTQQDSGKTPIGLNIVELNSCDLDGRCSTTLSEHRLTLENSYSTLVWLHDGRMVFSLLEPSPDEHSSNLWALDVDPDTGHPRGQPTRLTNWTGFTQRQLTASADGKRLVVEQVQTESMVRIGELSLRGERVHKSRPLNSETWSSRAVGWLPNSRVVLFTASRYGRKGIFTQNVDGDAPESLVSGAGNYDSAVVTPDGTWVLYTEHFEDGSAKLMRRSLKGGQPVVLLPGNYGYRCASSPTTLCVLSELQGNQLEFSVLNALTGRGQELTRMELKNNAWANGSYHWSLSPDGKSIALVDHKASRDHVLILSTAGGTVQMAPITGWENLQSVNWAPDGRHLYISGTQLVVEQTWAILEADLKGNVKVLAESPRDGGWVFNPIPSPDGHYLIYTEKTWQSSVLMLEDF